MKKRVILLIYIPLLFMSTFYFAFDIQPVEASGTIYIRADGSVDPHDAPIQSDGNSYTFTDNIYDEVVVQKGNIVIDGANYRLRGTGVDLSKGIDLSDTTNVTLRNVEVADFYFGIFIYFSCDNTVGANTFSNNTWGIFLADSCDNVIAGNAFSNNECGVYFHSSSNNTLTGNNASNNTYGILLDGSINNTFIGNTFSNNEYGIYFRSSTRLSNNAIFHNIFVNNREPARIGSFFTNVWDNGYPSGGNYWSGYAGVDEYQGPNQDTLGSDGIGDTPYVIDENNLDNYPLMEPLTPPQSIRGDVNGDGIVDIFDVVLASLAFDSRPDDSNWNQAADLNNDDVVDIFDIVLLANNFGKTT